MRVIFLKYGGDLKFSYLESLDLKWKQKECNFEIEE